MPWQIDQSLSIAGREVNEDRCGAAADLAWVLDGAGLGREPRFPGFATDAAWLVAEVDAWLQLNAATMQPLPDLLVALQTHLTAAFGAPDPDEPSGGPSACLTLARLRVAAGQYLVDLAWIADTVALVPLTGGIDVISDDRVGPFESATLASVEGMARVAGQLPPAARHQININRAKVNRRDGYAVVSPSRPWCSLVCHATLVLEAAQPLVLMSDGVSRLFDLFGAMTAADLHAACARGEAAAMLDRLRAIERADAAATRYNRFKIHDDATLLVVRPKE